MSEQESSADREEADGRNQMEGFPTGAFTGQTYENAGVPLIIAGMIGVVIGLALLFDGVSIGTLMISEFTFGGIVLITVGAVTVIFSTRYRLSRLP